MNINLKNIIPNNSEDYKISFDSNLGNAGVEIFNWLQSNKKIKESHSYKGIPYRWVFGISGDKSIDYIVDNLPEDLSKLSLDNIINYLDLSEMNVNEIKFEVLGSNKFVDEIHLKRSRFKEIKPIKEDNLPFNYENEIFYSAVWHTDKTFDLSNYKILIYLNDVKKNQGGLVISEPILSPKQINGECVLTENIIDSDKVEGKEVLGKAGTTASFNSHILHRANLPKDGYRCCLHLSFILKDKIYKHRKYSRRH